eukprot:gene8707-11766_t
MNYFMLLFMFQLQRIVYSDVIETNLIRSELHKLSDAGRHVDVVSMIENINSTLGSIVIDDQSPSLYNYYGVALYSLLRVDEAKQAFIKNVELFPGDTRGWINLGEVQVQTFQLNEAIVSFTNAFNAGDGEALSRILRTIGWCCHWHQFEKITYFVERNAKECELNTSCILDASGGLEYTDIKGHMHKFFNSKNTNARLSSYIIPNTNKASFWKDSNRKSKSSKRLKVGFISSDFGVHPVSSLIRGLFQFIDKTKIELFCFSLQPKMSWWGENITETVEHFIGLHNMNTQTAAYEIASRKIEILIDLNGHTMHSGLPVLSHKPAPIQLSYLGLPTSTASLFIDYYIADRIALPPEHTDHFTEKLLLMNICYIVNDYSQVQGDILKIQNNQRAPRSLLPVSTFQLDHVKNNKKILFATLSNSQKMDPHLFHVWMNILRHYPGSQMLFMEYSGYETYMPHLKQLAKSHGISPDRLVLIKQSPWIDHLYIKTSIDIVLDTVKKNGHTTGLDGVWSGIPTVTMGGGITMSARAGESIAVNLESELGLSYSLKEYEDISIRFANNVHKIKQKNNNNNDKNNGNNYEDIFSSITRSGQAVDGKIKLELWRNYVNKKRYYSSLFDTRNFTNSFTHLMEATWEVYHLTKSLNSEFSKSYGNIKNKASQRYSNKYNKNHKFGLFHVFSTTKPIPQDSKPYIIPTAQVYPLEYLSELQRILTRNNNNNDNNRKSNDNNERNNSSNRYKNKLEPLPSYVFDGRLIMLNIGGITAADGWLNVNSQVMPGVHINRDMHNLEGFADGSVTAIYSSHTLEHNAHGDGMFETALAEWRRVLRPGGIVMISVPDLRVLSRMLLDKSFDINERWKVIMMMYGAQSDPFDYHQVGFDEDLLVYFMNKAGFCQLERVGNFNLPFIDTSSLVYKNYKVSLNIVGKVCYNGDSKGPNDFSISHSADPYWGE